MCTLPYDEDREPEVATNKGGGVLGSSVELPGVYDSKGGIIEADENGHPNLGPTIAISSPGANAKDWKKGQIPATTKTSIIPGLPLEPFSRQRIEVVVRIRPVGKSTSSAITVLPDGKTLRIRTVPADGSKQELDQGRPRCNKKVLQMVVDRVHGKEATQGEVYKQVRSCVLLPFQGVNACILAYGQTGSGKTYTMMGGERHGGSCIPKPSEGNDGCQETNSRSNQTPFGSDATHGQSSVLDDNRGITLRALEDIFKYADLEQGYLGQEDGSSFCCRRITAEFGASLHNTVRGEDPSSHEQLNSSSSTAEVSSDVPSSSKNKMAQGRGVETGQDFVRVAKCGRGNSTRKEAVREGLARCRVECSYMQVYNGLVYDLLACDNDQRPLKLCHSKAPGTADVLHSGPTGTDDSRRDDACADRGFTREDSCGSAKVIGLSCHRVHDAQQVMDFLTRGKRHLRVRSTEEPNPFDERRRFGGFVLSNPHSSRSHSIAQFTITRSTRVLDSAARNGSEAENAGTKRSTSSTDQPNGVGSGVDWEGGTNGNRGAIVTTRAVLKLVDLAGSEKYLGCSGNEGQEDERCRINSSLSALSSCISCLGETDRTHVPFRDSVLTRLLQDSLCKGKTTIIATIRPSADVQEESISTLNFAARCMRVTLQHQINEVVTDAQLLQRARRQILLLRRRIQSLESASLRQNSATSNDLSLRTPRRSPTTLLASITTLSRANSCNQSPVSGCELSKTSNPRGTRGKTAHNGCISSRDLASCTRLFLGQKGNLPRSSDAAIPSRSSACTRDEGSDRSGHSTQSHSSRSRARNRSGIHHKSRRPLKRGESLLIRDSASNPRHMSSPGGSRAEGDQAHVATAALIERFSCREAELLREIESWKALYEGFSGGEQETKQCHTSIPSAEDIIKVRNDAEVSQQTPYGPDTSLEGRHTPNHPTAELAEETVAVGQREASIDGKSGGEESWSLEEETCCGEVKAFTSEGLGPDTTRLAESRELGPRIPSSIDTEHGNCLLLSYGEDIEVSARRLDELRPGQSHALAGLFPSARVKIPRRPGCSEVSGGEQSSTQALGGASSSREFGHSSQTEESGREDVETKHVQGGILSSSEALERCNSTNLPEGTCPSNPSYLQRAGRRPELHPKELVRSGNSDDEDQGEQSTNFYANSNDPVCVPSCPLPKRFPNALREPARIRLGSHVLVKQGGNLSGTQNATDKGGTECISEALPLFAKDEAISADYGDRDVADRIPSINRRPDRRTDAEARLPEEMSTTVWQVQQPDRRRFAPSPIPLEAMASSRDTTVATEGSTISNNICHRHRLTSCVLCDAGGELTRPHSWSPLFAVESLASLPLTAEVSSEGNSARPAQVLEFKLNSTKSKLSGGGGEQGDVDWQAHGRVKAAPRTTECEEHLLVDCILCKTKQWSKPTRTGLLPGLLHSSHSSVPPPGSSYVQPGPAVITNTAGERASEENLGSQPHCQLHDLAACSLCSLSYSSALERGDFRQSPLIPICSIGSHPEIVAGEVARSDDVSTANACHAGTGITASGSSRSMGSSRSTTLLYPETTTTTTTTTTPAGVLDEHLAPFFINLENAATSTSSQQLERFSTADRFQITVPIREVLGGPGKKSKYGRTSWLRSQGRTRLDGSPSRSRRQHGGSEGAAMKSGAADHGRYPFRGPSS